MSAPSRQTPAFISRVSSILLEDAASWGLASRAAWSIALLPVIVGLFVAVAHLHHPLYRFLTAEDSILEWLQVGCVAATFVVLLLIARTLARRRDWVWVGLYTLGAVACVGIVGEEISWGQRLFGIVTPETLQDLNTQGETNLHNVRGVLVVLNTVWMIGAGILATLPLAAAVGRSRGLAIPSLAYRVVPPLALVPAFGIPFVYRLMRFVAFRGTSGSFAEFVELSLYFGIVAFALLLRRRIDAEEPEPAAMRHRLARDEEPIRGT